MVGSMRHTVYSCGRHASAGEATGPAACGGTTLGNWLYSGMDHLLPEVAHGGGLAKQMGYTMV